MMDNIREKLVKLLGKAIGDAVTSTSDGKDVLSLDDMASCLIANGVTVQEWIPVTKRLPDGECLAVSMLKYQPSYKEMLVGYVAKDARYETGYCCESDDVILPNVTHWAEKPYPVEGGE